MRKDKIIIIFCVVALLLIIILITKNRVSSKNAKNNFNNQKDIISENILFDKETNLYYVRDSKTNEIISVSHDESNLEFYKDNPDYNPNPLTPRSTDLSEYVIQNIEE